MAGCCGGHRGGGAGCHRPRPHHSRPGTFRAAGRRPLRAGAFDAVGDSNPVPQRATCPRPEESVPEQAQYPPPGTFRAARCVPFRAGAFDAVGDRNPVPQRARRPRPEENVPTRARHPRTRIPLPSPTGRKCPRPRRRPPPGHNRMGAAAQLLGHGRPTAAPDDVERLSPR